MPRIVVKKGKRLAIYHRDNFMCCYCRRRNTELSLDHIIPLEAGGDKRSSENLVVACRKCNTERGGTSIEDYADHCESGHGFSKGIILRTISANVQKSINAAVIGQLITYYGFAKASLYLKKFPQSIYSLSGDQLKLDRFFQEVEAWNVSHNPK